MCCTLLSAPFKQFQCFSGRKADVVGNVTRQVLKVKMQCSTFLTNWEKQKQISEKLEFYAKLRTSIFLFCYNSKTNKRRNMTFSPKVYISISYAWYFF